MPAQTGTPNTPRPITAAGEKLDLKSEDAIANMRYRVYAEWQHDAWGYYDAIGEIKYGFGMVANILSRVRLYPAFIIDPDSPPQSTIDYRRRIDKLSDNENERDIAQELKAPESITPEVMEYMEELVLDLATGPGGMSSFLRAFALNMSVPGECYLVEIDGRWTIKSSDEIVVDTGGQLILRRQRNQGGNSNTVTSSGNAIGDKLLPKNTNIIRVWREHPRYSEEPESSMLGLREACDELLTLQRMIRAVARSNMNAGILFIPDTLRAAGSTVAEDIETEEELGEELIASIYDNMTAPITDETNAGTVVPTVLTGPGADGKDISYTEINRKVDQYLTERCDRALERVLQGIDMPKDFVTGLSNVRYCVDPTTEALTRTGWKHHSELVVGEEILTLNHITGLSEWQPVTEVSVFAVENEQMLSIEQRGHSSFSTMDHRWPVLTRHKDGTITQDWTTSGEFTAQHSIRNSAQHAGLPTEAKYTDDFVELIAWLYTEGSFDLTKVPARSSGGVAGYTKRRRATISQSGDHNPHHVERITGLLTRLYGTETSVKTRQQAASTVRGATQQPQWRRVYKNGHVVEFHLNEEIVETFENMFVDTDKTVDREFIYALTKAQLDLFINVSVWADGSGDPTGAGAVFGQKVESRLDIFELACHLAGRPISRRSDGTEPGRPDKQWYDVRLKSRTTVWPYRSRENTVLYTGDVWCPTTPNSTWFARRNGTHYWSGNTNARSIDEQLYKSHIEPMVLMLIDALNVGYFLPAIRKKFPRNKITEKDLRKLTIWYDPSEIITRVDPSEAADKGFDKYAISADAWRRSNGFADTDAPSEEEQAIRMLQKAAIPPDLVTPLFNTVFPQIVEKQRDQALQKNPGGFPESARNILYGNDGTDDAPTDTEYEVQEKADPNAPMPGSLDDITADDEDDDEQQILTASAAYSTHLYNQDYVETDLQQRFRIIAEAAVRGGDYVHKLFRTKDITPTQPPEMTDLAGSGAGAKDLPPIVVKYAGKDFLLDGHHRAARRKTISAAYVDLDNLKTAVGKAV